MCWFVLVLLFLGLAVVERVGGVKLSIRTGVSEAAESSHVRECCGE
ncbi:hypothetical protein M758_6G105700 [Ceratodon purpureus]|nr:hypothetical protein M758_6G105700 [Ceratodon purpureus]